MHRSATRRRTGRTGRRGTRRPVVAPPGPIAATSRRAGGRRSAPDFLHTPPQRPPRREVCQRCGLRPMSCPGGGCYSQHPMAVARSGGRDAPRWAAGARAHNPFESGGFASRSNSGDQMTHREAGGMLAARQSSWRMTSAAVSSGPAVGPTSSNSRATSPSPNQLVFREGHLG